MTETATTTASTSDDRESERVPSEDRSGWRTRFRDGTRSTRTRLGAALAAVFLVAGIGGYAVGHATAGDGASGRPGSGRLGGPGPTGAKGGPGRAGSRPGSGTGSSSGSSSGSAS